MKNILIVVGATRPNNYGFKVGQFICKYITKNYSGLNVTIASPNNFVFHYDSDKDPKYTKMLSESDAAIFVVSEYNHGYPGKLKTLIDSEYDLYENKKILLVGVSSGPIGGARAVNAILPVFRTLKARVFYKDILFTFVQNTLKEDNIPEDIQDANLYDAYIKVLDDFLRWK